jgi:tRNA(Ile)-lysidine synthase
LVSLQNDKIIRPLFFSEKKSNYANENGISGEDSSNASDKYLRNKIRHDLVPLLKELNPYFIPSFQKTQSYLQESQAMVEDASIMVYQQVARQEEEGIYFDLNQLRKLQITIPIYTSGCMNLVSLLGMIFMIWLKVNQENTFFSAEFRLLKR